MLPEMWWKQLQKNNNTGCFIMFSVFTNIYNKKTKGPTLMELFTATEKLKKFFLQLEMFDVCTTGDMAHIDTIFKFLPHTHQRGYTICLYIHPHRLVAEMWTTMKNNFLGKTFLSSFYLYRFRKYVSYGFPIINFCYPGVHYEMSCIFCN
jgi:hypothetical protein